jgi:ABC-type lipoprotein export system ATPase subunit
MVAPVIKLQSDGKVILTDEVEALAVSEIDLEVAKADYVSIAGSSGCGKSTRLSILGFLFDGPIGAPPLEVAAS